MHVHTIPPVNWFCWIPTNNLWSMARLSRLMLCFWLMSATTNGLMRPNFLQPKTNPSIWVTVGSTGKQKHVCTVTLLIVSPFCLNPSFKCSLSSATSPYLSLWVGLLGSPHINTAAQYKTYNNCHRAAPLTSSTGATLGDSLFKTKAHSKMWLM